MAGVTVIDANILIAFLDPDDSHHDAAVELVSQTDQLAASSLSLAEALVYPAQLGKLDHLKLVINALAIEEVALAQGEYVQLARLRAETGLRLPDCCVLHAAETVGAKAIGTRDERLRRMAAARGFATP